MDAECRLYYTNLEPLPLDQFQPARSHLSVVDIHYEPFNRRTTDVGIVRIWYPHELARFRRFVFNGGFALAKAVKEVGAARSHRAILYARPRNGLVEASPNPQMPGRGSLCEIILDRGDDWAMSSADSVRSDLSAYFYTIRVPEVLEGLQGLPPLTVSAAAPVAGKH